MTVKEIRSRTGLSQAAFGKKYGIPKRTVENWETRGTESRRPPDYLVSMLDRLVSEDFPEESRE